MKVLSAVFYLVYGRYKSLSLANLSPQIIIDTSWHLDEQGSLSIGNIKNFLTLSLVAIQFY